MSTNLPAHLLCLLLTLLTYNANLCASIHLDYTTEYSTLWSSYPPRLSTSTGSSTSWVRQAQIFRSSTAYYSSLHLHAAALYGVHTSPLSSFAMCGRPYTPHSHLGRSTTTRHHNGLSSLNTERLGGLLSCS